MEEAKSGGKQILAEDLVSRFRSKEDIHRYLT